jgi:hypothetical protein
LTTDKTFKEVNQGDFDLVVLFFTGLQIIMRSFVVSAKYGTITEQLYRVTKKEVKGVDFL